MKLKVKYMSDSEVKKIFLPTTFKEIKSKLGFTKFYYYDCDNYITVDCIEGWKIFLDDLKNDDELKLIEIPLIRVWNKDKLNTVDVEKKVDAANEIDSLPSDLRDIFCVKDTIKTQEQHVIQVKSVSTRKCCDIVHGKLDAVTELNKMMFDNDTFGVRYLLENDFVVTDKIIKKVFINIIHYDISGEIQQIVINSLIEMEKFRYFIKLLQNINILQSQMDELIN